jgi:hypothetical protein
MPYFGFILFIKFIKSKKTKKMKKTPINQAISSLQEFKSLCEFSTEASAGIEGSVNITQKVLRYERLIMTNMLFEFFDSMNSQLQSGQIGYVNEETIKKFLDNYFEPTPPFEEETPSHGSYEHLQSLGQGRSKN